MKVWTCLLALIICVGFVGSAHAAKGKKGLRGKISSVSDDGKVVVKPGGKAGGDEVTVTTDDKTSVTVDGKDAKVKDLKAGLFVMITPAEGTATSIVAMTKPPEHKNKHAAATTETPKTDDTSKKTDSK